MTLDSSSDSDAGAKWTTKISMRSFLSSPATAFLALPLPPSTRRPPPPPHALLYSPLPLSPHNDFSHFFSYLGRFLSTLQAFLEGDVFPSHDAFPRSPASLPQEVAAPAPPKKRRRRRLPRSDAAAAQGFAALKRNCGSGASTARQKRRRRGGEDQRAGGVSATLVASSSQLTVSD